MVTTRETSACWRPDRKSTRLNSSHLVISYAVFCLKKKNDRGQPGGRRVFPTPPRGLTLQHAPWEVVLRGLCGGVATQMAQIWCAGGFFFFFKKGGPPEVHPLPPPHGPPY